jgi:hypothetical protein
VSLWFLYIAIGGMLVLFLLLKNAGELKIIIKDDKTKNAITVEHTDPNFNLLSERGILVILYFGGILISTFVFYNSLR